MAVCEQHQAAIPVTLKQIGSGLVDPSNSEIKIVGGGGQVCYVEVKNNTVHFTPIKVRFFVLTPSGEDDLCATTFQIASATTSVFKNSVFGDPPLTWRVAVSLTAEVDAAQILVKVFA